MKRLKKTVPSKNTTRKKNNGGMTYVELLVALSLLVLIVTMFSPMLLSSYDSIYNAGEMTSDAYDARFGIETELAYRDNDNPLNIKTNFEKLAASVTIKAKQIISVANGLETLYGGAKGRLKVISNNVVSDNQDDQLVRLLITNLDKSSYKRASSSETAKNPTKDEVLFYIHSVFEPAVHLNYQDPQRVAGTNYLDICIKGLNVTKGPIKILAYYRDDFDIVKSVETYLYIEPADMMFVGDSGTVDYFTSAGIDSKGDFNIAGRQMGTAPINTVQVGQEQKTVMLNDVEWVSPDNDSDISEGYYLMCGEHSVVRRLWREKDDTRSPNIISEHYPINGTNYFQYDWKGDYTDQYKYAVRNGATSESSSLSSSSELKKDQYGLNKSSYAYYFNGFGNTGWSGSENRYLHTKRISYVQYADKTTASEKFDLSDANTLGLVSQITQRYFVNTVTDKKALAWKGVNNDDIMAFDLTNKRWGTLQGKTEWLKPIYFLEDIRNVSDYGFWIIDYNCHKYDSSEAFYSRTAYYSGDTVWDSTTETKSTGNEEKVAYLQMKSYNNFNANNLNDTDDDPASVLNSVNNTVNLTSCIALPGKSGDTLYLGTTQANAIINQTNSYNIEKNDTTYDRDMGLITGHVLIGTDSGMKMKSYEQIVDNPGKQCYTGYVSPNLNYAAEQFKDNTSTSDWAVKDAEFTMGYASDLYVMYQGLTSDDSRPLEKYYLSSKGNITDDEKRSNIWFTREFYNITESDSYGKSVVACGYNVSGYTQPKYNEQYIINKSISFNAFAYEYSGGIKNRTEAQNEDALKKAADAGWVYLWNDTGNRYNQYYDSGNERWCTTGNDNYRFYFPDADVPNNTKFWVKLPKGCIASTELEKITNDGVLSVYNEGEATFTPIYYYKDPDKNSVRFNCVSALGISDNVVGAAIGLSNGKLILARIPYVNKALKPDPLTSTNCTIFDACPEISNVTAIKGFQYDISGDGTPESLIIAGGVKAGDKAILRISDISDKSKNYKILLGDGSSAIKVTDIAIVNGFLYVSAIKLDSNQKECGVIYALDLKYLKAINNNHAAASSTSNYINLTKLGGTDGKTAVSAWTVKDNYHTIFKVDALNGRVVGDGSGTPLPVINSIAAKAEQ